MMNWNDKYKVISAVAKDGMDLRHASAELQDDLEVVLVAMTQNPDAVEYASRRLQKIKIQP